MTSQEVSALGPIDPASIAQAQDGADETEKHTAWIVRKLIGVSACVNTRPLVFGFSRVCLFLDPLGVRVSV